MMSQIPTPISNPDPPMAVTLTAYMCFYHFTGLIICWLVVLLFLVFQALGLILEKGLFWKVLSCMRTVQSSEKKHNEPCDY